MTKGVAALVGTAMPNGLYVQYLNNEVKVRSDKLPNGTSLQTGVWTSVLCRRFKDGTIQLYKDGQLVESGTSTEPKPFGESRHILYPLELSYSDFAGAIKNIRVYNIAVSDEVIDELSSNK